MSTSSSPTETRVPVMEPEFKDGEKGKIGPKQYLNLNFENNMNTLRL